MTVEAMSEEEGTERDASEAEPSDAEAVHTEPDEAEPIDADATHEADEQPAKRLRSAKAARHRARLAEARDDPRVAELARARSIRTWLLGAAALAVVGIALVGTSTSTPGVVLVIVGVVGLVAGIHRFGRLGPETGAILSRRVRARQEAGDQADPRA